MAQHPDENVLLKARLHDEPVSEAGMVGHVRPEDFLNFDHIEIVMTDGSAYTIPRSMVREFIGVAQHAAPISIPTTATSYGGLGIAGTGVNGGEEDEAAAEEWR
jgi:hypothetical protein